MTDAVEKNRGGRAWALLSGEGGHLLRSLRRVGELTPCVADEELFSRDHSSLSKESGASTQLLDSGHDCGFYSESDGKQKSDLSLTGLLWWLYWKRSWGWVEADTSPHAAAVIQAEDDSDLDQSVRWRWWAGLGSGYNLQGLLAVGGEEKSDMTDIFILIIRGIELLLRTMGKDLGERFWRIG